MNNDDFFYLVLISMLVMFGLAMAVIILFNLSQKRILSEQQASFEKEMEFKNKLIENQIEVQEQERTRIARELHDDIGSKLNVIGLNMRLLKSIQEKGNDPKLVLDRINSAVKTSIVRTREIAHDLMPSILTKFGLRSALAALATSINKTNQLSMVIIMEEEWGNLEKKKELHLYRIIQELTTNTIKHAKADNIIISFKPVEKRMNINYSDDGIGIQNTASYTTGLGINNITTRCKLMNATLQLGDSSNKGFNLKINMPK